MATQAAAARRAWWRFPGWWAVLAGAIHGFMGYGVILYAWSAFVRAFMAQFRWTATDMGAVGSFARLLSMGFNPLGGFMTDKIGPRFNGLIWMVLGSVGLFALVGVSELWMVYVIYGVLWYGVMSAGLYRVSWVAANRWFIRRRAAGMGWIAVGTGFGGTLLVPLTGVLIGAYGWQTTVIILGVIWTVICIPLCFLYVTHMPEHYGMYPDNESPEERAAKQAEAAARGARVAAAPPALADLSTGQALRTLAFWLLSLGGFIAALGAAPLPIFQNVRMGALGYSIGEASVFYGLNFAFTVVGRGSVALFGDWASTKMKVRFQLAICYLGEAIGVLAFALALNPWFIWTWVVIHGVTYGASIPMFGNLMGSYFGRQAFGTIYGIRITLSAIGSTIAPWLTGWLKDVTGDWVLPFMIAAGLYALGGVVFTLAAPPPQQAKD